VRERRPRVLLWVPLRQKTTKMGSQLVQGGDGRVGRGGGVGGGGGKKTLPKGAMNQQRNGKIKWVGRRPSP